MLFNPRVLRNALQNVLDIPEHHRSIVAQWADSIRNGAIFRQNETHLEGDFKSRIFEQVLGYKSFGLGRPQTIKAKQKMGSGEVDLALGLFDETTTKIIAPFELKGASTRDLDAPMPGRKISPVQQAWHYANSVAGVKWVLVSNYVEIRLYAFGEGNGQFERFDLANIDDPYEYAKLQLVLAEQSLLEGQTFDLLQASKRAEKEISARLYTDYRDLRTILIQAVDSATGGATPVASISTAQKILDRVLFIAFAEDSRLVPRRSLQDAYEHRDLYQPRPVWENFKALFRAIDEGNPALNIRRYNGGLFKFDARIDQLILPDNVCEGFKKIGEYDFATEVGVTILGHIFEQSISDIERLLAHARGEEAESAKKTGTTGRRKRDGIVYTPEYIARFIVEKTLGACIDDLFWSSMSAFSTGFERRDYEDLRFGPRKGVGEALKKELKAWETYRDALKELKIVDPACGSGVFLVAAFDFLREEYDRVNKKMRELRGTSNVLGDIEDVDHEILSRNLYGVDVNEESVEITKLSLWLKTARIGKELDSLDATIRVGDSLIENANYAYLRHGFDWRTAFPEVFARGGFDIVIGNPPYVRMELIKRMKPYLKSRFRVVSDRADLYCYFFERGLRILKPSGRLGYISSSSFFKTRAGVPLRRYLLEEATIETVADFGDLQIFDGVTTYPAIITMRRGRANGHALAFWKVVASEEGSFSSDFDAYSQPFPQDQLGEESWELESPKLRAVRSKIRKNKRTFKQVYGSPLYGIKTGLNDAFLIDGDTKERLVNTDPNSTKLLKKYVEGKDLKRWGSEAIDRWIIYIPRNSIDIDDYPAIKDHLELYKRQLEKRATEQHWFELQQSQASYLQHMERSKISWRDISSSASFSFDTSETLLDCTCFFFPTSEPWLAGFLNSKAAWFQVKALTPIARGGFYRLKTQYVEAICLPDISPASAKLLGDAVLANTKIFGDLAFHAADFRRRIPDVCSQRYTGKLSEKLYEWWRLENFTSLRNEIKRVFKADIPLAERNDWERLFLEQRAKILSFEKELERNEAKIDREVFRLFDLTAAECALLEASLVHDRDTASLS